MLGQGSRVRSVSERFPALPAGLSGAAPSTQDTPDIVPRPRTACLQGVVYELGIGQTGRYLIQRKFYVRGGFLAPGVLTIIVSGYAPCHAYTHGLQRKRLQGTGAG